MLKKIRWKFTLIGLLVALSILFTLPSLTKDLPSWLLSIEGMKLGLDLQGGMHLILKVDLNKALENEFDNLQQGLKDELRKKQIPIGKMEIKGFNRGVFIVPNPDQYKTIENTIKQEFPGVIIVSSVSRDFGLQVEIAFSEKKIADIREDSVSKGLEIIRNRIDPSGLKEPIIVRQGKDEIVVQLPGEKDPQNALKRIEKVGLLEFKLVDTETRIDLSNLIEEAIRDGRLKSDYTHTELNNVLKDQIPPGRKIYLEKESDPENGRIFLKPILLFNDSLMSGAEIKNASVEFGGTFNEPHISIEFKSQGARRFDEITKENIGRRLAIILDETVQSSPVIRERISGGKAQITGSFSIEEAKLLADILRYGALPAPMKVVQNVTVGPTLGQDSIRKGFISGLIGTILVVLFMMYYYRFSGLIANFALLLNLLFMLAALSIFRATLTLPGIAGIILSVGMAVDSNILIFERMREEFAQGKPVKSGVDGGYDKAFWTIIDSHVTTLITAFALFLFGSGPIKGFAVTLSIGVIFNLFTALFCTRVVYDYLSLKRRLKPLRFVQFLKKPAVNFIGYRKYAFVFSGILVLLGLIAFVQIYRGEANLGVEFSGGTMSQFKAAQPFRLDRVRAALIQTGIQGSGTATGDQREHPFGPGQEIRNGGQQTDRTNRQGLAGGFSGTSFRSGESGRNRVFVSRALQKAALIAISISLAGIILYLAWRFELRFGVAAAIATFHDVLAVLGIFYLLNKEITLLIVTAILTLAGYSLTDTVVVFDRIRENWGKGGRRDFGEVINRSINEVLTRTIITTLTVFLVLLALYFLGGGGHP
jgi:SecD/SecF fusion protein